MQLRTRPITQQPCVTKGHNGYAFSVTKSNADVIIESNDSHTTSAGSGSNR